MVPETGLEPALVSQPDPKSGASTNSATQALRACRSYASRGWARCKWFSCIYTTSLLHLRESVSFCSRNQVSHPVKRTVTRGASPIFKFMPIHGSQPFWCKVRPLKYFNPNTQPPWRPMLAQREPVRRRTLVKTQPTANSVANSAKRNWILPKKCQF